MSHLFIFLFISISTYGLACENCYKWTTFKTLKYEIEHPSSWEVNEEGDAGTTFILYSESEDKNDSFKENVSLVIQKISNVSLEQYAQSIVQQISKTVTNSNIISNTKAESNGKEFQKIIYTGSQGSLTILYTQHITVHKNEIYILTYVCELHKVNLYKFKSDKILGSFYLKS